MKRIKSITIKEYGSLPENLMECELNINFHTGEPVSSRYEKIENLEIGFNGVSLANKIIMNIKLPSRDDLSMTKKIHFEECIFLQDCDLNFHEFNAALSFRKCIFVKELILFGSFSETVSFEESTFLGSKASFQECSFQHFIFNLVTLNNCTADFQETTFLGNNIFFGNLSLSRSALLFYNSFFSKNADLLDLIAIEADKESKILFRMVDFSFGEVRLFHSKINRLEFIDCTFECNRFDFDLNCETLIIQDCKNFRILTFYKLQNLKNLNIYNSTFAYELITKKLIAIRIQGIKKQILASQNGKMLYRTKKPKRKICYDNFTK